MNVCFYGTENQFQTFQSHLTQVPKYQSLFSRYALYSDYDSLVDGLRKNRFDLVFVFHDNACGMEGVIAIRNCMPNVPVIWFSNDEGFGSQAYRLHTDFFHAKPITPMILEMALNRALR